MPRKDPVRLVKVSITFLGIEAEWNADPRERSAAWSLYVELVTRIATQPLREGEGLFREALNSLHSLFAATREVLREAGPIVGGTRGSVGGIAIAVLNERLRPFLAKWHPQLADHEMARPTGLGALQHDAAWPERQAFRDELEQLRKDLYEYATALAGVSGALP